MKNKKTYLIIIVILLVLVVVGVTFAFFQAQGDKNASANVNVKTEDMDSLVFSVGDKINVSANQFDFGSKAGNKVGSTYAKATLKTSKSATANYYVYLNIETNDFEYTTDNKTAELILTVTDPSGNELTEINGLNYVTVNDIKGFDVTEASGLIKIVNNREITSTGIKEETWNVTLTFINLDSDQAKNAKKTFKATLDITKEVKKESVATLCKNRTLSDCVIALYEQGENNLYLHDSTLPNGAGDNSYRYAGSSDTTNNFVCFGYDSQDGSCPNDNLYRIIGVFGDEVKLIKYDYAKSTLLGTDGDYARIYNGSGTNKGQNSKTEIGAYYWNKNTSNNTWSESRLNTINLNKNYLNKIDENGTKWSKKISDHIWKVGGNTYSNIVGQTAPNAYQNEINNPATNKTVNAKVGLMYVSDYGYAASSSSWSTSLSSYTNANVMTNNWIYMGLIEWTLAPSAGGSDAAFAVAEGSFVYGAYVDSGTFGTRPVFYLITNTSYKSGNGTISSPIIINL